MLKLQTKIWKNFDPLKSCFEEPCWISWAKNDPEQLSSPFTELEIFNLLNYCRYFSCFSIRSIRCYLVQNFFPLFFFLSKIPCVPVHCPWQKYSKISTLQNHVLKSPVEYLELKMFLNQNIFSKIKKINFWKKFLFRNIFRLRYSTGLFKTWF